MDKLVPKITAALAWLRPVTAPTWIMRVGGLCNGATERRSTYGAYLRWRGTFQAAYSGQVVSEDGEVIAATVQVMSHEMILPNICEDWLALYFQRRKIEVPPNDDTMTGNILVPLDEQAAIKFGLDIYLNPPVNGKDTKTGYVYDYRVILREETIDPMAAVRNALGVLPPISVNPALPLPSDGGGRRKVASVR